jgi:hypothetical protein
VAGPRGTRVTVCATDEDPRTPADPRTAFRRSPSARGYPRIVAGCASRLVPAARRRRRR